MHNPNYSRQLVSQYAERGHPFHFESDAGFLKQSDARQIECFQFDIARRGIKFALPENGVCSSDGELRALQCVDTLALPFDAICLEYLRVHSDIRMRTAIFAIQNELEITFSSAISVDHSEWSPMEVARFSREGDVDWSKMVNGKPRIRCQTLNSINPVGTLTYSELFAILSFLNALACSNITTAPSPDNPKNRKTKNGKAPLDSYHILEVRTSSGVARKDSPGVSHASPREHIRRGHVRRLQSGSAIWVNAAIVNAGSKAGKVTKDYAVKAGVAS